MASVGQHLLIPVYGSDELVEVPLHDLPETVDDVVDILKAEGAPLGLWLDLARAYLAQGLTAQYERLLTEATSEEAAGFFGPQAKYERIQGFCSLAAFHAHQARVEKDRTARSNHFSRALELLKSARALDHEEQLPHLGFGQVHLAKGELELARKEFETAARLQTNGRPSIAGALALGSVYFQQKKYKESLELFRRSLRDFPGCPPEVRLGLAACYFKLGSIGKARAAYQRVLQLEPGCTQALLGLAVIQLSTSGDEKGVREGSRLLTQAFEGDPENPYVLVLLAHFCLGQGFHDKARRLAQLALERSDADALRAEGLTILARAQHALGQMQNAQAAYQQASQLDPRLPLPKFGLAQISLLQGEATNAVSTLEALLGDMPGWYDALRILGKVYPRLPRKSVPAAAAAQLREAAAKHSQRAEVWEMMGDVLAPVDPAGALGSYEKAIQVFRDHPEQAQREGEGMGAGEGEREPNGHPPPAAPVPARLLNNAAVLLLRQGGGSGAGRAKVLMEEALLSAQHGGLQQLSALTQVTLGYNMARVRESCGELQAAEAEYTSLLEQFPDYADCYLRLACVARMRGNNKAALDWAQKASDVSGHSSDSLALRAALYLDRRDYPNAKQVLDELLGEEGQRGLESYGKLAMANLQLYTAPGDRRREEQRAKAETHLSHALELFRRVLEKDPGNVYAANGVGCVLAEAGHLGPAKDIFLQVQEASAASDGFLRMPDAWVNLANVYLAQEQYGQAMAMYRNALRKFFDGRNAQLQLFLARSHYDADDMLEAKRVLVKALHLAPTDPSLRFDLALVMQEYAVRTLMKWEGKGKGKDGAPPPPNDPSKLPELSRALGELQHAHSFFLQLNSMGKASGIDGKKLTTHINFIAETHKKAKTNVGVAQREAEVAEARRREQQLRLEAAQRQREVEERKRALLEEAQARKREAQAREHAAKLERLKAEWKDAATLAKAAAEGDSSKVGKGRSGGGAAPLKSKADQAVDALFGDDDEEGEDQDYMPGQEDSDAERMGGAAALAAAGLASSSEEEDADFGGEEDEEDEEDYEEGEEEEAAEGGSRRRTGGGGRRRSGGRERWSSGRRGSGRRRSGGGQMGRAGRRGPMPGPPLLQGGRQRRGQTAGRGDSRSGSAGVRATRQPRWRVSWTMTRRRRQGRVQGRKRRRTRGRRPGPGSLWR